MRDLDKALLDIASIRSRMASGSEFQGFGALTIALTAALALVTGIIQFLFPILQQTAFAYFATWIIVALIAVTITGIEMVQRSRRHHGGLADEMLFAATRNFVPSGIVGALLLAAFALSAPDLLWLLPALWLILVGVGIFSALRMLPPSLMIGAALYIVLGFITLLITAQTRTLSPWAMALPFAIGQITMSILLHTASRKNHVK